MQKLKCIIYYFSKNFQRPIHLAIFSVLALFFSGTTSLCISQVSWGYAVITNNSKHQGFSQQKCAHTCSSTNRFQDDLPPEVTQQSRLHFLSTVSPSFCNVERRVQQTKSCILKMHTLLHPIGVINYKATSLSRPLEIKGTRIINWCSCFCHISS